MVQCADCGYFTMWSNEELTELDAGFRETPYWQWGLPLCFVRAANLQREAASEPGDRGDQAMHVRDRNRDCRRYVPWVQGFSPKEHLEMEWRDQADRRERELRRQTLVITIGQVVIGAGQLALVAALALR